MAVITQDGKPVIVTLSLSQFTSLLETIEIFNDDDLIFEIK